VLVQHPAGRRNQALALTRLPAGVSAGTSPGRLRAAGIN
jgi:hypothetical protein